MNKNQIQIVEIHECKWATQHDPVQVIQIKGNENPWTLRVFTGEQEDDLDFKIDIDYCPFCGEHLSDRFKKRF